MAVSIVGKRLAGIDCFIHKVFVAVAVELVRARFHGEIENATAGLSVFRGIVAGLNRDFLHCVYAGLSLRWCIGDKAVGRVLTFDSKSLRIARSAAHTNGVVGELRRARRWRREIRLTIGGSRRSWSRIFEP